MDGSKYRKYLIYKVLPMSDAMFGRHGYLFIQDGAPAYHHNDLQKFLERYLGSKGFWPKEMFQPSCSNLNPLDFSM